MSDFRARARAFVAVQSCLVVAYVLLGLLLADALPLRGWLGVAIGIGVAAIALCGVFVVALWRHADGLRGSFITMVVSALLVAAGWGFGVAGWAQEFAADQELPIINLGTMLTPVGLVLGALASVSIPKTEE